MFSNLRGSFLLLKALLYLPAKFSLGERVFAFALVGNAKKFLLSENFVYQKRKSVYGAKAFARKGENATTQQKRHSQKRIRVYRRKTWHGKLKTSLSGEIVAHKVEKVLTEQNRGIKRRKGVCPLKTSLPSENRLYQRKRGSLALTERKRG